MNANENIDSRVVGYAFGLPRRSSDALSKVANELVNKAPEQRAMTAWAHELPVWRVTERAGTRSNSVVAEGVFRQGETGVEMVLLVFPDAYEDLPGPLGPQRRLPSRAVVSQHTQELPASKLESHEALLEIMAGQLHTAMSLPLDDVRDLVYPAAFG